MTMYFVHKTKANNTILLICYLLLILIATLCCLATTTKCTSTSTTTTTTSSTMIEPTSRSPQVPVSSSSSMAPAATHRQDPRRASSDQLVANQSKSTDTQRADANAQPQPQLESRTRVATEPAAAESELERGPSSSIAADDVDNKEPAAANERDVNNCNGYGGCGPAATVQQQQQQANKSAPKSESVSDSQSQSFSLPIDLNELKHDNVHKLMSETDLRRTFYVDSHDQVPEYQILKLTVQSDGSHLISPISDLGELTTSTTSTTATTATTATTTTTNLDSAAAAAAARQDYERTSPSRAQAAAATRTSTTITSTTTTNNSNQLDPHLEHSSKGGDRGMIESADAPAASKKNSYNDYKSSESADDENDDDKLDETNRTSEPQSGLQHNQHNDYDEQQDQRARSNRNKRSAAAAAPTTTTNSDTRSSNGNSAQNFQFKDAKHEQQQQQQQQAINSNDKLIVMNLSTFGRDFNLRLKRNADFQQRIKDMKMFLAESTGDGQLRYTEIKSPHNQQQHQHHKQEPHKRAAAADEGSPLARELMDEEQRQAGTFSTSSTGAKTSGQQQQQQNQQVASSAKTATATATETMTASNNATSSNSNADPRPVKAKVASAEGKIGQRQQQHHHQDDQWSIGSTYHDEENLAALLIDHDKLTGQLQMDGTIGNDFVIKPMPRATMEALMAARQRQTSATTNGANGSDKLRPHTAPTPDAGNAHSLDLERSPSSSSGALSSAVQSTAAPLKSEQSADQQANLVEAANHMHDDDPHDDDEMFLDEDEALEMAHLHQSGATSASNPASTESSSSNQTTQSGGSSKSAAIAGAAGAGAGAPRTLSKAASERKWKKYRKLLAQTQVPKPQQMAAQQSATQRARRQIVSGDANQQQRPQQQQPIMSHHIVFKQRPSSEGSSSEHKHSFMFAPGQQTMEEMVRRFPQAAAAAGPGRRQDAHALNKRSASDNTLPLDPLDSMASSATGAGSRLSPGLHFNAPGLLAAAAAGEEASLTDNEQDPLGGQFYLEPGLMTGIDRAGHVDWTLNRRSSLAALPPYAMSNASNNTSNTNSDNHNYYYDQDDDDGRSYDNDNDANADGSISAPTNATSGGAHRRHKRQAVPPPMPRQAAHRNRANRRHKRQAPDVVWPEVLLVVDYDSFLLHGGDSREVKRYFVSFWNGVDLRYKLLVNPHIRISLAGMIVAKDRDATPYLERNRLRAPNADAVDAAGALTDMGKYLYREDRLPTYDLAVVITKLDMCRRRYEGGRCNRGTAGFAYVGGACVVNKRLEKVNSVAIIEDSGGFSGIIVAAHEVGHLLGCVHDGSPPPSYLGGPGATHCPWEDGFIMSDLRHTERGFRWSQCSVEQFKHFLNGETATCLYNFPHESQMLHRLLPGSMLSLDDQCKRDRGTNACFKDARVCAQLFCFDSASGYCVSYRPAAEGSPCGDGHVCRNGKCVGEIENIIPDYTHQSQTVVARQRPLSGGSSAAGHPSVRLADNGLSASSTSTATSSPDNKAVAPVAALAVASAPVTGGSGGASSVPQISSRMDTFPVDTPLVNTDISYNNPLYTDYQRSVSRTAPSASLSRQQQQQQLSSANYQQLSNSNYNQRHAYTSMYQPAAPLGVGVGDSNSNIAKSAKLVAQQHSAPGLRYAIYPSAPSDLGISATATSATMAASSPSPAGRSSSARRYQGNSQTASTSAIGLHASSSAPTTAAATATSKKFTTKPQASAAKQQNGNINSNSNLFASNSNPLIPTSQSPIAPLVSSNTGAATRQRQLSSSSSSSSLSNQHSTANNRQQSAYATRDNQRLLHKPTSAAGTVQQASEPQLAMNYDFYKQQAFVSPQQHQSSYSSGMVSSY